MGGDRNTGYFSRFFSAELGPIRAAEQIERLHKDLQQAGLP